MWLSPSSLLHHVSSSHLPQILSSGGVPRAHWGRGRRGGCRNRCPGCRRSLVRRGWRRQICRYLADGCVRQERARPLLFVNTGSCSPGKPGCSQARLSVLIERCGEEGGVLHGTPVLDGGCDSWTAVDSWHLLGYGGCRDTARHLQRYLRWGVVRGRSKLHWHDCDHWLRGAAW